MNKTITEYTITFEDIDEEDFITEDKQEADAKIEELKDNGEFYKVYQYYAKDWVYNDETGDWEESDVEVYYTKGEDEELEESSEIPMYIDEYYPTRQEAKAAEKVLKQQGRKTKVERHGNEYIVWTSYEKVEEDINQEDKIEYNIYTISGGDGVYNSHKVDTVETEEQAIDRVSELEAETGNGAYYTKVVNGKELEEAKSSNNKYEIEYATPNYTGGNVYVFTGKLKDGNYFIADDGYFIADDNGNVSGFDVRIVNMDPDKVLETDSDGLSSTLVDDAELQDEHLVKDLDENEAKEFTLDLLNWITKNEPEGNYNIGELQDELNVLKKSIQRNNKSTNENKDLTEEQDTNYVTDRDSGFGYAFQLSRFDILEVRYEFVGDNETPYFATTAEQFNRNKSDFTQAGQGQETILPPYKEAYDFYKKWDNKHLQMLTEEEYAEMQKDLDVLKNKYNYIENKSGVFSFYSLVELSKQKVKKTEAIDIKDNEFKVGDKVKIDYISDGNKYNDEVGTIKWIHKYKYYPNGKENEFEYKYQAEIEYSDGGVLAVNDIYAPGSGIVGTVKKVTEALDDTQKQENEKEEIEQQEEEIIDTENELEEGIKKEVYQYAKQQGLDIEKLRKQGIELETLEETLDTVIGNMVSKSAIEYMDKTGKDITWDFEVSGNDIKIIWNEV